MSKEAYSKEELDLFCLSWRTADGAIRRDSLVEWASVYEQFQMLVIENFPLTCDVDFLRSVSVLAPDVDAGLKKLKGKRLTTPVTAENHGKHALRSMFPKSWKEAAYFQQQFAKLTAQMRMFFSVAYPSYELTGEEHSWRFALSTCEGLHFDSYGTAEESDDRMRVRLFINLDDGPRVWRTSLRISEFCDRYWDELNLSESARLHPNAFNAVVNKLAPWGSMPQVEHHFPPGCMWACDSQVNSHEIVYGRRMAAYTFGADPDTVVRPQETFVRTMRRYLASRLGESRVLTQG